MINNRVDFLKCFKYNALLKKKDIVENDKVTITNVIKELDERKKELLQSAWVKVNKVTVCCTFFFLSMVNAFVHFFSF